MRRLIGGLVFLAGVVALSFWASAQHGREMERQIRDGAGQIAATSLHGASTRVSGRDIVLSGTADSPQERDLLITALDDLRGRRVVIDRLQVLTAVSPYVTRGVYAGSGVPVLSGLVPSETARKDLGPTPGANTLEVASGAPVGWAETVAQAQAALTSLNSGSWALSDSTLTLMGEAETEDERSAAIDALGILPDGIDLEDQITVRLGAEEIDTALRLAALDLVRENRHPITPVVQNRVITLRGVVESPEERKVLMDQMQGLPRQTDVVDDLTLLARMTPYVTEGNLTVIGGLTLTGAVPTEADRARLSVHGATSGMTLAAGAPQGWRSVAERAAQTLGLLQSGSFRIEDQTLRLTGQARSPEDRDRALALLTGLPEAVQVDPRIDVLLSVDARDADLQARATALVSGATHPVTIRVVGGEIVARGLVDSPQDRDRILTGLRGLAGQSGVINQVQVLPILSPYVTRGERSDAGQVRLSGAAPSEALRQALPQTALTDDLVLAAGAPFGWSQAVAVANAALVPLVDGQWELSDQTLTLTGLAETDLEKKAALDALADLQAAITLRDNISVQVSEAEVEAGIRAALQAQIAGSRHGMELDVRDRVVTLRGTVGSEVERDTYLEQAAAIPRVTRVIDQLTVLPALSPYITEATENFRGTITMTGGVPSKVARNAIEGADTRDLTLASGAPDLWEATVPLANAVLSRVDEGRWRLTDTTLEIFGTVNTPVQAQEALSALTVRPTGLSVVPQITVLDDGAPVRFELSYDAALGAQIAGKLPFGMSSASVGQDLGLAQVAGDVAVNGYDRALARDARVALGALAPHFPQLETLDMVWDEGAITIAGLLSPGSNLEEISRAVRVGLRAQAQVDLRVAEAADLPAPGTIRMNAATGAQQQLVGGYWVPVMSQFDPTTANCTAQAARVMSEVQITFVTGSARLSPESFDDLNKMSALLQVCVLQGGLRAIVGGHTDGVGVAESNLRLSEARAASVVEALIARGIPDQYLRAVGYGETQPVADNSTEAGRAANRRTTLEWAEIP